MARFKVGEEVKIKGGEETDMTLVITQITEVTCSAGTQVQYLGRVWQNVMSRGIESRQCLDKLTTFMEIELESKGD